MKNNISQMKAAMNGNPMAFLQGNPMYKQVQELIDQHGGDAKAAFYALAEENGIDGDEIISMLK